MRAGGGTSFRHAFEQIQHVLFGDTRGGRVRAQAFEPGTAAYEAQRRLGRQGLLVQGAPAFVTSVAIVFMTDGQDNTMHSNPARRPELVGALRRVLAGWDKDVIVHTVRGGATYIAFALVQPGCQALKTRGCLFCVLQVGFSRDHDFEFLDQLRRLGKARRTGSKGFVPCEGLFRFADPADGCDALCAKLSELTDAVLATASLRVTLALPFQVIRDDYDEDGVCGGGGASGTAELKREHKMEMRGGRGALHMFVKRSATAAPASVEVSVPAPRSAASGEPLRFTVPVQRVGSASAISAVSTAGASGGLTEGGLLRVGEAVGVAVGETLGEAEAAALRSDAAAAWEDRLVARVVAETVALAEAPPPPPGQLSAGCSTPLAFRLNVALVLQRCRALLAFVGLRAPAAGAFGGGTAATSAAPVVVRRLELCRDQLLALLDGRPANAARLRDAAAAVPAAVPTAAPAVAPPPAPRAAGNAPGAVAVRARGGRRSPVAKRSGRSTLHEAVLTGKVEEVARLCLAAALGDGAAKHGTGVVCTWPDAFP